MDVVLFGPPKEPSNLLKDMMVALLLILLLSALTWAYHQKKKSEQELFLNIFSLMPSVANVNWGAR